MWKWAQATRESLGLCTQELFVVLQWSATLGWVRPAETSHEFTQATKAFRLALYFVSVCKYTKGDSLLYRIYTVNLRDMECRLACDFIPRVILKAKPSKSEAMCLVLLDSHNLCVASSSRQATIEESVDQKKTSNVIRMRAYMDRKSKRTCTLLALLGCLCV